MNQKGKKPNGWSKDIRRELGESPPPVLLLGDLLGAILAANNIFSQKMT